jgi:hypothetical protein
MENLRAIAPLIGAFVVLVAALTWIIDVLRSLAAPVLRRREPELVVRRCDRCGRGWKADPRVPGRVVGLRVRRWVRHRAREKGEPAPNWAGPQGWSRCPSCLSSRVRTSGEPPTRPGLSGLEKAGVFVGLVGVALLTGVAAALAG